MRPALRFPAPLSPIWAEHFSPAALCGKFYRHFQRPYEILMPLNSSQFFFFFPLHTAAVGFSMEHLVNSNTAVDKICQREKKKKQLQIVVIVLNVHPKHKYQTSSGGSACNR